MNKSKSKKNANTNALQQKGPSSSSSTNPDSVRIEWPLSFVNFLPNKYQQINDVIPGQIYTLPSFFSSTVCDDLIRYFEKNSNLNPSNSQTGCKKLANKSGNSSANNDNNTKLNFATTQLPPKKDYAARVNDRAQVYDKLTAQRLWKKLRVVLLHEACILNKIEYGEYHSDCASFEKDVVDGKCNYKDEDDEYGVCDGDEDEVQGLREEFEDCIGLNDHFRIYRYIPGHYFGQHYDESVKASVIPLKREGEDSSSKDSSDKQKSQGKTVWTMLVYLTGEPQGEVTGGETLFYPNERDADRVEAYAKTKQKIELPETVVKIQLNKGTALLHKHGDDCLLHESAVINSGVKWVLRTDLVF